MLVSLHTPCQDACQAMRTDICSPTHVHQLHGSVCSFLPQHVWRPDLELLNCSPRRPPAQLVPASYGRGAASAGVKQVSVPLEDHKLQKPTAVTITLKPAAPRQ